jgi:hypothetical protein
MIMNAIISTWTLGHRLLDIVKERMACFTYSTRRGENRAELRACFAVPRGNHTRVERKLDF